jgi:hypothetical protein
MTNDGNIIYKSKNEFKILYFIMINFMIGAHYFIINLQDPDSAKYFLILFIPANVALIYLTFFYEKPEILYSDRLQSNIYTLNLKTKERKKIEVLLFKNINEIYFPKEPSNKLIYFRYNKNYEITFHSMDEYFQNVLKEYLIYQYSHKIIKTDKEPKTNIKKFQKLFFIGFAIPIILILIGLIPFNYNLPFIILIPIGAVLIVINFIVLAIYNFKVLMKEDIGIWNYS